jgi:TRAP-type C4-dicarboxylate transport system permease small subunit
MNRKTLKTFLNISIIAFCIILSSTSFTIAVDEYILSGRTPGIPDAPEVQEIAIQAISIMRWIGYACALGMIMLIGIKYVLAAAEEKASLKGMLLKVTIGSIILVCAVEITNAVISVMSGS